jgi:hypothetical protein
MYVHPSRSYQLAVRVNLRLARPTHRSSDANRGNNSIAYRDFTYKEARPFHQRVAVAARRRRSNRSLQTADSRLQTNVYNRMEFRTVVPWGSAAIYNEGVADHKIVLVSGT